MRTFWKSVKLHIAEFCAVCIGAAVLFTVLFYGEKCLQKLLLPGGCEEKVLVLGDSIWDLVRDESGISANLVQELGEGSRVYNCSVKGTSAAINGDLDDCSLIAQVAYLAKLAGNTQMAAQYETYLNKGYEDVLLSTAGGKELKEVVPEQISTVILAYGLNDYFGSVPLKARDDYFDVNTYSGALCSAVRDLQVICPEAKIVIASPTYCQGYDEGVVVAESTTNLYGGGSGIDYVEAAKGVALSFNSIFLDNYKAMGISIHNGSAYLEDATHLTKKGRRLYAQNVAALIKEAKRQ